MTAFLVGPDGRLPLPWLTAPLQRAAAQRGHALLLHGGEGRGLFELAMVVAQGALCTQPRDGAPCGRCDDCHLVLTQVHPDLLVLLPEALRLALSWRVDTLDSEVLEGRRKPSQEIRITDMRAAIDWSVLSASRGARKLLVIHPAARMNDVTANALLKTLEEPPGGLRLVLTTSNPSDLLPTIASRCQHQLVPAPARTDALAWLRDEGVADAEAMLDAAGGEPLSARLLAEQGVDAEAWRGIPASIVAGRTGPLAGWSVPMVVDALVKLCHDAMCVSAGAPTRYFAEGSIKPAPWDALRRWSTDLREASRHAEHPWAGALAVDALVLRASRVWREG